MDFRSVRQIGNPSYEKESFLDRRADEIAVLGPAAVVILDLVQTDPNVR